MKSSLGSILVRDGRGVRNKVLGVTITLVEERVWTHQMVFSLGLFVDKRACLNLEVWCQKSRRRHIMRERTKLQVCERSDDGGISETGLQ